MFKDRRFMSRSLSISLAKYGKKGMTKHEKLQWDLWLDDLLKNESIHAFYPA